MIEGRVVLFFRYVKTRVLMGKDALIPKALPKILSRLVILYLLLVQPVLQVFSTERWVGERGKNVMELYKRHLFVRNGVLLTGESVQNLFRLFSRSWFQQDLKISVFRQLVKAIFQYRLKYSRNALGVDYYKASYSDYDDALDTVDDAEDTNSDPLFAQFGHSAAVSGTHYAVSADSIHAGVTLDRLSEHLHFSAEWHRYMGLYDDTGPSSSLTSVARHPIMQGSSDGSWKSFPLVCALFYTVSL